MKNDLCDLFVPCSLVINHVKNLGITKNEIDDFMRDYRKSIISEILSKIYVS